MVPGRFSHGLTSARSPAYRRAGLSTCKRSTPPRGLTFDPERNVFICPQAEILKYRTARQRAKIHMYRATAGDCKMCSIRQQCTRGQNAPCPCPFDEAVRQDVIALALQKTEASRRLREMVEMLFAHMKQHFRLPSQTERVSRSS
jgi:hypothetical protein